MHFACLSGIWLKLYILIFVAGQQLGSYSYDSNSHGDQNCILPRLQESMGNHQGI